MMGIPTETDDSRLTVGGPAQGQTGSLNVGDSCMVGGPLAVQP